MALIESLRPMSIDLATLKDLREKIQAATGPDAEIDARMMCVFAAPPGSFVEQSRINGAWMIYEPTGEGERPHAWDNRIWPRAEGWALTASLEAALDFAERIYNAGQRAHWVAGRHAWPIPENVRHYALFPWGTGTASTAALAVLAAVLNAKISAAEKPRHRLAG